MSTNEQRGQIFSCVNYINTRPHAVTYPLVDRLQRVIHLMLFYVAYQFHYSPWVARRRPYNHNVHHLILQCTQTIQSCAAVLLCTLRRVYSIQFLIQFNFFHRVLIWDTNYWDAYVFTPSHLAPALSNYV